MVRPADVMLDPYAPHCAPKFIPRVIILAFSTSEPTLVPAGISLKHMVMFVWAGLILAGKARSVDVIVSPVAASVIKAFLA